MNRPVARMIAVALVLAGCGYRPSAVAPTLHPASSLAVTDLHLYQPNSVSYLTGSWSWSIPLKVQPATTLPAPAHFALGRWRGNIELLEVTPSVIHLRAVINGVSPGSIVGPGIPEIVALIDSSGTTIGFSSGDAGIIVPKQQVNPVNYQNSRIDYEWPRPATGGTFQLRFQGGGGSYSIPLTIEPIRSLAPG